MSNDAKKTVDAIANKKLGDLGVSTPIEGVEDLFGYQRQASTKRQDQKDQGCA